ncbi:MAG: class IV adenylate cyclase [Candidatus Acidiferrales bacterium]
MKTNREVEIKLRVDNVVALLERLRELGAEQVDSVHEENTLFDTSDREFQQMRAVLRLRRETPSTPAGKPRTRQKRAEGSAGLLTFKGPAPSRGNDKRYGKSNVEPGGAEKYKIRQEIECRIGNADRIETLLERLGLRPWFRYEKYRTKYRLRRFPRLHLDLDETPVGTFLELEGAKRAIDATARALGYGAEDYIAASYLDLYSEDCQRRGVKPGNMMFRTHKSR